MLEEKRPSFNLKDRFALHKSVFTLAWPAIIEQMLHMTVGLVDNAMVGRIGAPALAGVGLANQVMMLSTTVLGAVATGNTALVSRNVGGKHFAQAGKVAEQAIYLAIGIALVVMTILLGFDDSILRFLFRNTDPAVLNISVDYMSIVALGLIFNYVLMLTNGTLRGAGDTKTPMQIAGIVNLVNIVGNYILIFGFGPIPAFGVKGAAISTAFSHLLGGILAIIALLRNSAIEVNFKRFQVDTAVMARILKIGVPAAVEQGSMRLGQLFYTMIIASLGTVAYAAHQVALNAESLSFMPGFGFSLAAATLVGQNLGAHDPDLAERSGNAARDMAVLVMSGMAVIFVLFSEPIIRIFTPDPDVISLAAQCLRLVALSQPALAIQMVYSGGLRVAGDTKGILWITLTGFMVIRLSLAYVLSIYLNMGLIGAWIAMAADLNVRALWVWLRYRNGFWKSLKL